MSRFVCLNPEEPRFAKKLFECKVCGVQGHYGDYCKCIPKPFKRENKAHE